MTSLGPLLMLSRSYCQGVVQSQFCVKPGLKSPLLNSCSCWQDSVPHAVGLRASIPCWQRILVVVALAHAQGEVIVQSHESQEVGAILGAAYHKKQDQGVGGGSGMDWA